RNINSVAYDGSQLKLNNHTVPRNPISQCQASAFWLRSILQKSTGTHFSVRPIIALPSKFIAPEVTKKLRDENVYMLNPKAIRGFLIKMPPILSEENISMASLHLSRIITARIERR